MALTGDTGNGATLTMPGSYSVALTEIQAGAESIETYETSVLATTGAREFKPAELSMWDEVTFNFKWVPTVAKPTLGTVGTCTITWPLTTGSTAANLSGTGFLTSWKPPTFVNGQMQVGEGKFKFDGDTGPTYTVES